MLVVFDRVSSKFGALGISRRESLMFKDLKFETLSDLVRDFIERYSDLGHTVMRISFSLPVEHDIHSNASVGWNVCVLGQKLIEMNSFDVVLSDYVRAIPSLMRKFRSSGSVPRFRDTIE